MARTTLIRRLAAGALVLALAGVGGWLLLEQIDQRRLDRPIAGLAEPRTVVIEPGSSLTAAAGALAAEGLLEHPGSWIRQARREGAAARIRAGEYRIAPGTTPRDLLGMLTEGRVQLHSITVPEGWTFRQALDEILAHPAVAVTLAGATDDRIMAALGLAGRHPEGMFFPDTYLFARGTTDLELLRQASDRLQLELDEAWAGRADDLPIGSPYEALILASIVEKETAAPDERPVISGVFVNRLRRGMRLQTDPTVIYGLGDSFDGNLRRADLTRDTPYNTYTRGGLPPTPIALVGREALHAAVRPEDTESLYFVATGRGDGRHLFARTLAEHNDNVARYIATLRGARRP